MTEIEVGELKGRVGSIESRLDRIESKLDRMIEEISGMSGGRKMLFALLTLAAAIGGTCVEAVHWLGGRRP